MSDPRSPSSLLSPPQTTEVELTWIAGRIEHRVEFGHPIRERIVDERHRVLSFAPGSIFAVIRWASTDYGTTVARIEVLRGVRTGKAFTVTPFVRPGAEILLRASGWADVQRVIRVIDTVRTAQIDPADAAPDYWLHVGNRIAAGEQPRPYTRTRHIAWKLRRRLMP